LGTASRQSPLPWHGEHFPQHMGCINDRERMPTMWGGVSSGKVAEQVLQQAMPAQIQQDGAWLRSDGCRIGASCENGKSSRPEVGAMGACSSQERKQARQQNREFGDTNDSGPHKPSYVQASESEGVSVLRNAVPAGRAATGAPEDMFQGVSIQSDGNNPALVSFLDWQRQMRGALSQLPMASGPWIWKPLVETAAPMQHDLFGGVA
jgi:hypothetical protein